MKKLVQIFSISLLLALFTGISTDLIAQGPPPPPGGGHGHTTNQPPSNGGGAPIGTAVTLMVTLFGAYGAKKVWDNRKRMEE